MKNKDLVLLDLFSGMGGFHLGLESAGFKFSDVYYSEIDRHAIANYKYNFKDATYIGAVESVLTSGIKRPNIITFGSPCQDFSIAGARAGLSGTKSSLIEQAITTISHFQPGIYIWENVKGAFTSNNREDFWAIIQAFANIRGYDIEWQLVNTSWLLPQNRERVYLIGHRTESFGGWKGIFPVTESDRNTYQKNEPDTNRTQTAIRGTITTGYGGRPTDTYILLKDSILRKGYGPAQAVLSPERETVRQNGRRIKSPEDPSFTLTAQDRHGIFDGKLIRRFTEKECERLQGYCDDWTRYGDYDGIIKEIPRTQRYRLCGNAVTRDMVELLGHKMLINLK